MISSFRSDAVEICALLRCNTASNDPRRVADSSWTYWPLKMGPIYCPETSVKDYHSRLGNTPEESRSLLRYIFTFSLSSANMWVFELIYFEQCSNVMRVRARACVYYLLFQLLCFSRQHWYVFTTLMGKQPYNIFYILSRARFQWQ
jgi:hypothetical protein